jgi:transposase-like protein
MRKRKIYDGDFKARVVIEAIQGVREVADLAKDYDLHPNQIKNWKCQFLKKAKYVLEDRRLRRREAEPSVCNL